MENKRKVCCLDYVLHKLFDSERDLLVKLFSISKVDTYQIIKEKEITKLKTNCVCPYNSCISFGYNYYCIRERVQKLIDTKGNKTDLRQLEFEYKK